MLDELAVFKIVMERLNNAGINYMVSGSVAMNYYAQPRMTRDVDIIVELHYQNANKFYNLFQKDFYIDLDMMKEAISHKKVFNIIHSAEAIKVDFIIRKESKYRRMEFERRRKVKINETEFYIASIEDLILKHRNFDKQNKVLTKSGSYFEQSEKQGSDEVRFLFCQNWSGPRIVILRYSWGM